ncbi:S-layer homology domain-containing protein [Paenibacillus sp. LHD-117]|uniref:S-layer homology domain-containing protein n=1 Tax=Paenibacillus sp. LHD-117 TaxID=3071412 RepID=UPI0035A8FC68
MAAASEAVSAGLMKGVTDDLFAQNELTTRAQMATILKRSIDTRKTAKFELCPNG